MRDEKLFARHDFDIGKLPDRFSLKFEIRDEKRFYHPGYRMSEPEREILKRLENKFIDQGILKVMDEPSAFRSPSFVIKKPGKSDYNSLKNYRYLTDFRAVNKLSFFAGSNLPNMEDFRTKMKGFKYISRIDFVYGFYALPVAPECQKYLCTLSADRCRNLTYQRAPMGHFFSPMAFNSAIEIILDEIKDEINGLKVRDCVLHFIDDVYVFTKNDDCELHWKVLKIVFQKLIDYNLKLRLDKINLFAKADIVLGIWTDAEWTWPDEAKISVLKHWSPPTVKKGLQRFLGLINFYRSYVEGHGLIVAPLYQALKKSEPDKIIWTEERTKAFHEVKEKLINATKIALPDYKKPFILSTDAAHEGLGAAATQIKERTTEKGLEAYEAPLGFYARAWNKVEKKAIRIVENKTLNYFMKGKCEGLH